MRLLKNNLFLYITFFTILIFTEFNLHGASEIICAQEAHETSANDSDIKEYYKKSVSQTYSMTYLQILALDGILPAGGIGYRRHIGQHGFDISANACHFTIYGSSSFFHNIIPFFKGYYLNYPNHAKNNFYYWGIGAIWLPLAIPWPMATIGYEWNKKNKPKMFIQLEATYPAAAATLGFGF